MSKNLSRCIRRMSSLAVLAVALLFAGSAMADPLSVPQIQVGQPIRVVYHCPGGPSFTVTYLNSSDGQSFAVMPVDGKPTLLVATMSADGVRYQSGFVTWWSKGKGGSYYDANFDSDKPKYADCVSK